MNKIYDVYSLGNAIVDVQTSVNDDVIAKMRVEKGSMRFISELQLDQTIEIIKTMDSKKSCGGSAANSIIALAQMGGRGVFCNMVGGDEHGDIFCQDMQKFGVKFNYELVQGQRTSTCIVLITPDAERTMFTHLGASSCLSEEIVSEELIAKSKWVYIEGYMLSNPKGPAIINKMLDFAIKHNARTALSCSDIFIVDLFKDKIMALADKIDLVFGNKNEVKHLVGVDDDTEAFNAYKSKFRNVIMTLSAKGAKYVVDGEEGEAPGVRVKAVDTTGAGDMFAGAVLYGMTNGISLDRNVRIANFLAAQVVGQFGARLTEIPDYSHVK